MSFFQWANIMIQRIHPLVATAAVAVILLSMTGIAAMMGWLPTSSANKAEADLRVEETRTPTPKASVIANNSKSSAASTQAKTPSPVATCAQCGKVEGVRSVTRAGDTNGIGVAAGAIIGGLLGNQVGGGDGRTLATIAGAVGGGYTGNEVEKHSRQTTSQVVDVRMDNGSLHTYAQTSQNFYTGELVRVNNGKLERR
jgi:outer membrane lipoprotein SlyB